VKLAGAGVALLSSICRYLTLDPSCTGARGKSQSFSADGTAFDYTFNFTATSLFERRFGVGVERRFGVGVERRMAIGKHCLGWFLAVGSRASM